MTPLYWTANGGSPAHVAVAKFLLKMGADVNTKTTGKNTTYFTGVFVYGL
jgi:hypothetical protein